MAKQLIDGVNEVLKRVGQIDNDSGLLTSLTDSALQSQIDVAVQVWNEVVDDLFLTLGISAPQNLAEDTITLVTGQRDYALATDLVMLKWPLIDETNGREIVKYPGGYEQMVADQLIPSNYEGVPLAAAIRPTDGKLYLDTNPTSDENGLVYKYRYLKDLVLSAFDDTFPFTDAVFRSLVPAVSELWKYEKHNQFGGAVYKRAIGKAARLMRREPRAKNWFYTDRFGVNNTDPLEH